MGHCSLTPTNKISKSFKKKIVITKLDINYLKTHPFGINNLNILDILDRFADSQRKRTRLTGNLKYLKVIQTPTRGLQDLKDVPNECDKNTVYLYPFQMFSVPRLPQVYA